MNYRAGFIVSAVFISMMAFPLVLSSQTGYPRDYFRPPVDFRILLSGTFGELRAGHFHSGMDIKTGGVSGKSVYAVADGYISRIRVSATGFGKTLYVTHPNGYVSVYAHLSSFRKDIAAYVKKKHYELESFELNLYPGKGELPVKKGDVIALSGNSGGSNGPHLHFEMRLASTETPVNPLLFGFDVKDYIRPEIQWIKVYPMSARSLVDGAHDEKVFIIEGWGENHRIKNNDTIIICGAFALGINTADKLNDAPNSNGVYSIKLFADGSLVYSHEMEKFDFAETRYINSLIDYREYVDNKRRYQRTELDPNNKLSIYNEVLNRGILHFEDEGTHRLEYVVEDVAGNISILPIFIYYIPEQDTGDEVLKGEGIWFSIDSINSFSAENFTITVPGRSLYRDIRFEYSISERKAGSFSRIHHIHRQTTPVHVNYDVRIIPDSIPEKADKLLLARISKDGGFLYSGGDWKDGALEASLLSFGDFVILMDTIPPEIIPVNIASGRIDTDRETIKVKIRDELSGIRKYRPTLNGSWLLMDYDAKNNLLTYFIDERLKKGSNTLRIEVTDQRDNKTIFEKTIIRE